MFGKIGPLEIGLILLVVVMIFGVGKLPEVGSAIGKSIRAFKKSQESDDEEEEETPKPKKRRVVKKTTPVETPKTPVDDKTQSA